MIHKLHNLLYIRFFIATVVSLLVMSAGHCQAQTKPLKERPTIAVVLAGGGAKGVAHIGALKVIEEAGIPIDMIVGNSMGAIVGGLYSIGYTTAELDSIVRNQDWMNLLLDRPDTKLQNLVTRKMTDNYIVHIPFDKTTRELTRNTGVIQGRNIEKMLKSLTTHIADSADFNQFPIPFCAVSTDVIKGHIYEFHSGNLIEAMRSSMAIPGVFTPIKKDSMLLVDGCILNNFPVDVAQKMGADIIIGLDLENDADEPNKLTNMVDMLTHIMDVTCNQSYEANVKNSDIYVPINVEKYTAASFSPRAIDSLVMRGEQSMRAQINELYALKERLHLSSDFKPETITHSLTSLDTNNGKANIEHESFAEKMQTSYKQSSLNLGARFDNEEYASLLINANLALSQKHSTFISLAARLGKRLDITTALNQSLWNFQNVSFRYTFQRNDLDYDDHGASAYNIKTNRHLASLTFWQSWHKVSYYFGASYEGYKYTDISISSNKYEQYSKFMNLKHERFFTYFAQLEFNNQNSLSWPTRGTAVEIRAELISEDLISYKNNSPFPILSAYWETAISANSRFTITPSAYGRVILCDEDIPLALKNVIGGLSRKHHVEQQIAVAGIAYTEQVADALLGVNLKIQQRMGSNHFVFVNASGASNSAHFETAFERDTYLWGINGGYAYRSIIGPISFTANYSSRTKNVKVFLNIGYVF